MKYVFIVLGAIAVCLVMILPISAFAVKQGFSNPSKSWAPSAVYNGARIRMKVGRYRTAAMLLEKALEQWPKDERVPKAHYWIALSYEKAKQAPQALKWYGLYLTKYPKHLWTDQARRRVDMLKANDM